MIRRREKPQPLPVPDKVAGITVIRYDDTVHGKVWALTVDFPVASGVRPIDKIFRTCGGAYAWAEKWAEARGLELGLVATNVYRAPHDEA